MLYENEYVLLLRKGIVMNLKDINLRDPYILPFEGTYYMYGTNGFDDTVFNVYKSCDLENWSEPKPVFEGYESFWADRQFWAPEVHIYNGRFMMLASFKNEKRCRGTQILVSDSPEGPFKEHSRGVVTPDNWECLDGTLYIENGEPYMIFCHEWVQIENGTVCSIRLSKDLKRSISEPEVLWYAKDAKCFDTAHNENGYVTDGPFLIKFGGELICIWSTVCKGVYKELIARSDNGRLNGKWSVDEKALFENDGGHGMIFKTFDDKLKFIFHTPNTPKMEHPCILDIEPSDLKQNNEKDICIPGKELIEKY